jgi:hypothetical protein
MWGDAGLFILGGSKLATMNPARWSTRLTPKEVVQELFLYGACDRPVRIYIRSAGPGKERNFDSVNAAVRWILEEAQMPAEVLGREALLDAEGAGCTLRYMWADAGIALTRRLAHKNPLRWSNPKVPEEIAKELKAQAMRNRPVKIYKDPGHVAKEFDTVDSALKWIIDTFQLPEPQEKTGNAVVHLNSEAAQMPAEVLGREALFDAKGADCTLRYMWADAGTVLTRHLAYNNPLRWSKPNAPEEVAKELRAQRMCMRSVRIYKDPGHVAKEFETVSAALEWIVDTFQLPEPEEQKCAVCLENLVTVMLMPCRHAVLCDECAETILGGSGKCPICRESITNHAHGEFTSEYVQLVEASLARLERSREACYGGMYNNVRPLMVTGALLAGGACVTFVIAPPVAPVLAGAAFAIGYVPWFATTVAHLERENLEIGDGTHYFSMEDLSNPIKLIVKALTMAVVVPLGAVVFFIPYGLYAGCIRPLSKAFVHGLIRVCCFAQVYAVRPTAEGLQCLTRNLIELLRRAGLCAHSCLLNLVHLLTSAAQATGSVLSHLERMLRQHVISPCIHGARHCGQLTYSNILLPTGTAIRHCADTCVHGTRRCGQLTYSNILLPTGTAIRHCADITCEALYNHILVPSAHAGRMTLRTISDIVVRGGEFLYAYVLVPGSRAIVFAVAKCRDGVVGGASLTLRFVLRPCSSMVWKSLKLLARGIEVTACMMYTHVIAPLGKVAFRTVSAVARVIAAGSGFLRRYALVPLGHGAAWVLSSLANGLVAGARGLYGYMLVPCAAGVAWVARGVYYGSRELASFIRGVNAWCWGNVLVPVGRTIAAGAVASYIYVISPCGRFVFEVGSATARATGAVAGAIVHAGAAAAHTSYVYVLLPSGQAIRIAVISGGQGLLSCSREFQRLAVSVRISAMDACRSTTQTMRATVGS